MSQSSVNTPCRCPASRTCGCPPTASASSSASRFRRSSSSRSTPSPSRRSIFRSGRCARARPGRSSSPLRAYAGFDWDHDKYYRADRDDKDDKIFYYEKRLTAGVRFDLRHVGFEVYGGWAFDRFYFEGDRYGNRHDNRIDVDDGPFIVGKVSVRF